MNEPGKEGAPSSASPVQPPASNDYEFDPRRRIPKLDQATLEQELAAAMGGLSEQEIYGDLSAGGRKPAPGPDDKRKKGKVLQVRGSDVFVDIPGGRTQGVLSLTQFPEGPPAVGSEVEVEIEGYDQANGLLRLQRKGAAVQVDWSSVAVGMTVEARVTGTNKGGLAVEVNGIRGFMPFSQIDLYHVGKPEELVHQRLLCQVTQVDPRERNLVVSRRVLLEKQRDEQRERLWQELAEGQVREGVVRSVKDFGAFVDLGGADGLVHVSDLSWTRVADATTVVQPGQKVKVVVLKIDRDRRKISLGMKQLQESPWDTIQDRYGIGAVVSGKVTRLMDFGAFVELEPGIEGLIHISELAPQRVRRVADIVKPDQVVQVKVLSLDKAQRRIALSLKAALPEPAEEPAEEEEPPVPEKPPRPRTTPLRGGIGSERIEMEE